MCPLCPLCCLNPHLLVERFHVLTIYGDGSNLVPLVNIKIAGRWMFIPLKMVLIDIDPYPNMFNFFVRPW